MRESIPKNRGKHDGQIQARDFVLRSAIADDLTKLQRISALARRRYASIPSLAHIADSPALEPERFAACRIVVAADCAGGAPLGFAMTRLLDQLLYLDNISVAAGESGQGIGVALLSEAFLHARAIAAPAVTLTTFREPVWNGPWFRRKGFAPMPVGRIRPGLGEVLARQAQTLDPLAHETLWLRL